MIGCFTAPSALRFERPATTGPTLMLALIASTTAPPPPPLPLLKVPEP